MLLRPPPLPPPPPMEVKPPPAMASTTPPPPSPPSAAPCAVFGTQVQFFNLVMKFGKLGQLKIGFLVMNCYVDRVLVIL
jgi:hypothetical protein